VFGIDAARYADAPAGGETEHAEAFRSWNVTWDEPLGGAASRSALADAPPPVLRAKGILHFDDETSPHVYQRVGRRWSLQADPAAADDTRSRLVIIGFAADADLIGAWADRLKQL